MHSTVTLRPQTMGILIAPRISVVAADVAVQPRAAAAMVVAVAAAGIKTKENRENHSSQEVYLGKIKIIILILASTLLLLSGCASVNGGKWFSVAVAGYMSKPKLDKALLVASESPPFALRDEAPGPHGEGQAPYLVGRLYSVSSQNAVYEGEEFARMCAT
jgi:hypothetical protein